ncbi:MAG: glycine--tRNA ligase subunit beta [Candidatus Ozemobacteraceae bacterium]
MPLTFLAEAGFWGLPRGCLAGDPRDLAGLASDFLARERLGAVRVRVWFSSARIAFLLEGLPDTQADQQVEVRGPRASVAYDFNKQLTPAATGFAAGQGADPSALFLRDVDGEKFLFTRKTEKGKLTLDMLPGLTNKLFGLIPWNTAAWATGRLFPQPPAYICSLIEDRPSNLSIEDSKASRETGIREGGLFRRISLSHAGEFPRILNELEIQPLPSDRQKFLETQFQSIVEAGSTVRRDPLRLERLCFERERPRAFSLSIPTESFALPTPIFNQVLDECPSFLPVESSKGVFLPSVLGFSDFRLPGPDEMIIRTNALRARLEEAARLWAEDVKRPLSERVGELRHLPTDDGQGTRYDAAIRLSRLAHSLAEHLFPEISEALLDRCLVFAALESSTAICRRFPRLEGEIVGLIAERQGLEPELVAILRDLRLTGLDSRDLPATPVGQLLLLATLYHQTRSGRKREEAADRFLELLLKREFPADLLPLRASDAPEDKMEKAFWKDAVFRRLSGDGVERRRIEWLFGGETCPPLALYQAAKRWPDGAPREFDFFVSLQGRIKSLLPTGEYVIPQIEQPASGSLEEGIIDILSRLEPLSDGEILRRLEILIQGRAELEACMMGLPPVLDVHDSSHGLRIQLLKRIFAQLARPPFFHSASQARKPAPAESVGA